ncbi:hemin transporter HemP [Sulfurifustis variabilis]|uniref:Hemin transporter HemP n=1 Tax=Sulfurifustis variabilis TaxID=1675686 RepID=A0A1B4V823_9GAMM|nr:hemin transporter HemP [Sulfurifustis variabilis]
MNPSPAGEAGSRARAPQKISSRALLAEADELVIEHNGREYHLRVTSNGKLILTA